MARGIALSHHRASEPDGSHGTFAACHGRNSFSSAVARQPENCGKCHLGPDHLQIEIYNESKHGIEFRANIAKMNLDSKSCQLLGSYFPGKCKR